MVRDLSKVRPESRLNSTKSYLLQNLTNAFPTVKFISNVAAKSLSAQISQSIFKQWNEGLGGLTAAKAALIGEGRDKWIDLLKFALAKPKP